MSEDQVKGKPPDGGFGWVIVAATLYVLMANALVLSGFGILYGSYTEQFDVDQATAGWISSLQFFSGSIAGLLVGKVVDRHGSRLATAIGATVAASGMFLSAFSPNIYLLYVSNGILYGIGSGLLMIPSIVIVQNWFEKKRALVHSIAVLGFPTGVMVSGPVTQFLKVTYGWRGTLIIYSGISLNSLVAAALFRSPPRARTSKVVANAPGNPFGSCGIIYQPEDENVHSASKSKTNQDSLIKWDHNVNNKHEMINKNKNAVSASDDKCNQLSDCEHGLLKHEPTNDSSSYVKECVILRTSRAICQALNCFVDFSLLKTSLFTVACVGTFLLNYGNLTIMAHAPSRAFYYGMEMDKAQFLPSISGFCNVVGTILGGLLGNMRWANLGLQFSLGAFLIGVCTMSIGLTGGHFLSNAATMALHGFLCGIVFSIHAPLFCQLVGVARIGQGLSLMSLFSCVSALTASPFSGWLFDISRNYNLPFFVCGGLTTAAGCLLFSIPVKLFFTERLYPSQELPA